MKIATTRPPMSQAMCRVCYVKRFSKLCQVLSPDKSPWPCFDCGAITKEGIFGDWRSAEELKAAKAHYKPRRQYGEGWEDAEVREWIAEHGEYRYAVIGTVRGNNGA